MFAEWKYLALLAKSRHFLFADNKIRWHKRRWVTHERMCVWWRSMVLRPQLSSDKIFNETDGPPKPDEHSRHAPCQTETSSRFQLGKVASTRFPTQFFSEGFTPFPQQSVSTRNPIPAPHCLYLRASSLLLRLSSTCSSFNKSWSPMYLSTFKCKFVISTNNQ